MPKPSGIVAFLTDFGLKDPYVGVVKGVILSRCPHAKIVDLTHEVEPQNLLQGALYLKASLRYFPVGTVFLAVVDPGVGGRRDPIAVETENFLFVGPDNGLLYPAVLEDGIKRVVRLSNEAFHLKPVSRTFHARDIFGPAAGALASGVPLDALGEPKEEMEGLQIPEPTVRKGGVVGVALFSDRFGNVVTNIPEEALRRLSPTGAPEGLWVEAKGRRMRVLGAYSGAAKGEPLAIVGSMGLLEIAVREGSAREELGLLPGDEVTVLSPDRS